MNPSALNGRPSALGALGDAISHMKEKLFPFNFVGWITLGFVGFLESCGSGGGGGGLQNTPSGPSSFDGPFRAIEYASAWVAAHMIIFVSGLMVVVLIGLALMWLRARMIFVYIDAVASGRFDLVRPWNQHSAPADSFFVLSLIVHGAAFVVMVLLLGFSGFFALWARSHHWGAGALLLGALPLAFLFVLAMFVAALLDVVLRDFVAPLQLSRNVGAREAGGIFLSLLSANLGLLIGYAVLKLVAHVVLWVVVGISSCLTCCIAAIPVLHQTLFQPIYYAERAWSLKLLAQLGEDVFEKTSPPPQDPPLSYGGDAPTEPFNLPQIEGEDLQ